MIVYSNKYLNYDLTHINYEKLLSLLLNTTAFDFKLLKCFFIKDTIMN